MTARDDPVASLLARPRFGSGLGIHRVAYLIAPILRGAWGPDRNRLDAIHVTGSAGKGSVAAMTAAILRAAGVSTGLYLSPHIHRFAERITVDGEEVSVDALGEAVAWVERRWARYQEAHPDEVLGRFGALTAAAMRVFARAAPEALVLEAGIGGRYDPTRLVPGTFGALVSVDLEHTDLLGTDLETIARDKAEIVPPGGTLIAGRLSADVLEAVRVHCATRDVDVVALADIATVRRVRQRAAHMLADLRVDGDAFPDLRLAVLGRHQLDNAAIAIAIARRWLSSHRPTFSKGAWHRAVRDALAALSLPGRFERIHRRPDIYIDVAHTPKAIEALVAFARRRFRDRPVVLLTGVSADKDPQAIVAPLLHLADRVVVTRARERGGPVERVAEVVRRARPDLPVDIEPRIETAVDLTRESARASRGVVLVAGGLFLAREAAAALRKARFG